MGTKKKNLLVIMTDQQRYDTISVFKKNDIDTPNLNRLCNQSTVFRRTYVTQPVCTPSRGTLMTGLYPHNHGCYLNNIPLSAEIPTIAEMLPDNSYKTAYMGKWHLGDEMVAQHGFSKWVSTEEYREFLTREKYKSLHSSYYDFLKTNGFLPDDEAGDSNSFSRYFCTRLPERFSKPAYTIEQAAQFLCENKDQPFVLYLSFLEPHPPYNSAFDEFYDHDEVELPPLFNQVPGEDTPLKYRFNRLYHQQIGRQYPLNSEGQWRKLIARYRGAVTMVDRYVGKVLDMLKNYDLEDNTIVVFVSDHGDMMGDFGMLQKYVMYESATRVPLMIKIPGVSKTCMIEEPVSLVDLVPTLLDAMDIEIPAELDGKSLLPVISGEKELQNNDVFIEWNGDEGEDKWFAINTDKKIAEQISSVYGAAVRTIVTSDGWKLSISSKGENELYNLTTDQGEQYNLYSMDEYRKIVKVLTQRINDWKKRTNDYLA